MTPRDHNPPQPGLDPGGPRQPVFWRVENSLLDLGVLYPLLFFAGNAQTFNERWVRRAALLVLALVRPLLYVVNRALATRLLHTALRGMSRDRLDLLGEEYFAYRLQPLLKQDGVAALKQCMAQNRPVVLVSQGLDHLLRPLARHLGVAYLISNRLDFRDGRATGRLLEPVVRPRGPLAWLTDDAPDGRLAPERLGRRLALPAEAIPHAITPAERPLPKPARRVVLFGSAKKLAPLSIRRALAGKEILLVGVTGFIGKVWLTKVLLDLPEVKRIYLLIRRQRSTPAVRRFGKIVAEMPVFDPLHERYGEKLADYLGEKVEVLEGDISQPGLGLDAATRARLARTLDLVVNSSGLTDFNPDLRLALATNVDGTAHLLDFLRTCNAAALLHLSTCYIVGARDGRVAEELVTDYSPAGVLGFDAEREYQALWELVRQVEARAQSPEVTEELRRQIRARHSDGRSLTPEALEEHVGRYRPRWIRQQLVEAGMARARQLGWPNTYTFTKSLAESLLARRGAGLPIAVARPSIVESSLAEPIRGWNEGVGTSAPLAYLLGTYFRQLPSNARKRLDLIPVDQVVRGMMLVAAALLTRRHQPVYQLATSTCNPCDMRRSIELTGLAHRKHYRAQEGLAAWLRLRFDSIPVSKQRYQRLSAPGQKRIIAGINRLLAPLPVKPHSLLRRERSLEKIEKLIETYVPFILENDHVFEAEHIEELNAALVEGERAAFGYDTKAIDWWDYWINLHVPALRQWCYPLIEGRPLEYTARRNFQWPARAASVSQRGAAASP